jgi:hypothetical protein
MGEKLITVLTPTYNRASLLKKCYKSLQNQTCYDFDWMIIDDGSQDNTSTVVESFLNELNFNIIYFKKENGGKHTAVNFAVNKINTVLTLILDSDDELTSDAIQQIVDLYDENKNESNICGFTFLKQYSNKKLMGEKGPINGRYNVIDWRVNGIVPGEQCDVFFTEIMKRYPFSEYVGENYIGESTLLIRMATEYDMICKNVPIYIAEYKEGGLTKSGRKMRLKCPRGGMEYANLCMLPRCSLKRKMHSAILYNVYGILAGYSFKDLLKESNCLLCTFFMRIPGILLCYKWRKMYNI